MAVKKEEGKQRRETMESTRGGEAEGWLIVCLFEEKD